MQGLPLVIAADEVKQVAQRISASKGKEVTPAQVVLAWSQLGGHSVIPKSVTPSRIRENFHEIELEEQDIAVLEVLGKTPTRFNIPFTCEFPPCRRRLESSMCTDASGSRAAADNPRWNINIWNEEKERDAKNTPITKL